MELRKLESNDYAVFYQLYDESNPYVIVTFIDESPTNKKSKTITLDQFVRNNS